MTNDGGFMIREQRGMDVLRRRILLRS